MYRARQFAVRHARLFDAFYRGFERVLVALAPVWRRIGHARLETPVAAVERAVKGFLFDCRMCGQCVLSSTGMSCPMNCPKGLRNGPCGGVRPGGSCEVEPTMRCVWVDALEGAARMEQGMRRIAIVQAPVDHTLRGSSSWLRVVREKTSTPPPGPPAAVPRMATPPAAMAPAGRGRETASHATAARRCETRPYDPVSDAPRVPPDGHRSASALEQVLRRGWFAVTAELNPPDSGDPRDVLAAAAPLRNVVDAINATDASGANCHMSSMGISSILTRAGVDVVLQVSCRDRNRIAIQGDVLGAAAMGVGNILCLTGDGVGVGDQPGAKPVFDLDSSSLLETLRTMRDEARFLSGRPITSPPRVFLGAAENPCAPPHELRVERLAKKVLAGADFVQTNYVFDVGLLERFMSRVRDTGLDQTVFILVGVGPLPSPKAARWLRTHVPGIHIPDALIERVERASRPQEEGKKICIELIQQIREVKGVAGVHLMAYRREHLVEEIVEESGLLRLRQARADSATPPSVAEC
jgi:methylenetetrahydrofolate reductase (NADPH)